MPRNNTKPPLNIKVFFLSNITNKPYKFLHDESMFEKEERASSCQRQAQENIFLCGADVKEALNFKKLLREFLKVLGPYPIPLLEQTTSSK